MTVQNLDIKTTPRLGWLALSNKDKIIDNKVVKEGDVYTYIEKNLQGETDVPIFTTYIESIFSGANDSFIQLRYTWLISENVTEIKTEDKYGILKVSESNENIISLHNDAAISLDPNSVRDLYGDFKFKVADSPTLRFYPFIEQTIVDKNSTESKSNSGINATTVPTITATPVSTITSVVTTISTPTRTNSQEKKETQVKPGKPEEEKQLGSSSVFMTILIILILYIRT
ncbi:MAG TPA: hypothetical protein DHV62_01130, partial [Elusimicrobia bacterium]|nr:hypothetical protein [Elusimicrobiota bacterium]